MPAAGQQGATVAVSDLTLERSQKVAAEITAAGFTATPYETDVTSSDAVKSLIEAVLKQYGQVDILVNNAGGSAALINKLSRFAGTTEDVWSSFINLNLFGSMRTVHSVIKHMIERKSGRIINIGSIASEVGIVDRVDYSAAKAGVVGMTKALAMEVSPFGVTVNCVSPGLISRTEQTDPSKGTFIGRTGEQKEVAALVAFLASPEAAFITGANYVIDGGRTLGPKSF